MGMTDTLLFYISAASDLERERDVLSRAVTEIPVTLGWRIVFSPIRGEAVDREAVEQANYHVVILGSDIRAPIGYEWLAARRTGRSPLFFLKGDIIRTPAGHAFQRHVEEQAAWRTYRDLPDLRRQVLADLSNHLLDRAGEYRLSLGEVEKLQAWRKELEVSQAKSVEEQRSIAGESSVILSPERYVPSEGVLIRPKKK
jgi:hypothetical protein